MKCEIMALKRNLQICVHFWFLLLSKHSRHCELSDGGRCNLVIIEIEKHARETAHIIILIELHLTLINNLKRRNERNERNEGMKGIEQKENAQFQVK